MRLLGYGEDALTLWALQRRLPQIMLALGDSAENVLEVFFRPSFGRRSRGARGGIDGPQFGEFDAIVVSGNAIYLVEAKWTGSGELARNAIVLRQEQLRRHRVFREYVNRWRRETFETWVRFIEAGSTFTWRDANNENCSFTVAPVGSRLAANLEFILKCCAQGGDRIEDVLLAIHPLGEVRGFIPPDGFRCVELVGPPIDGNFVQLGAA